ncbi:hypothetical protein V5O48_000239, partial [Marasmius crinis-equi]
MQLLEIVAFPRALQQPLVGPQDWHWSSVKESTLFIPVYTTLASALLLSVHLATLSLIPRTPRASASRDTTVSVQSHASSVVARFKEHVHIRGGATIYALHVARLVCSLTLLAISSVKVLESQAEDLNTEESLRYGEQNRAIFVIFLYATFLALLSVLAKPRWSGIIIRHFNLNLLVTFAVYLYRDIYPFATFNKTPQDLSEGWLLWLKITLLGIASILVPLFIPRQYKPVRNENPSTPNLEETASLFSSLTYSFLDPLVFYASRVPHLSWDKLPPLSEQDSSRNLKERNFHHLDVFSGASKERHIAFGLLRVFRMEYLFASFWIAVHVFANFLSPIGMNQLLRYLEPGGAESAVVRPWVWVLCLFLGPVLASLTMQSYMYITTRVSVQAQAIFSQLIFEHTLRIRMKAELPDNLGTSESPFETVQGVGEGSQVEQSGDTTGRTESSSGRIPTSDSGNLVGRINNLVTTDLDAIIGARDFLFVLLYSPLQIVLSILFLYAVLGWSALVGSAVMVLTLWVNGLVARLTQDIHVQGMKRTDARVQLVTETMNVIRMVKLFGWERKMKSRIFDKREEELVWIKRRQYLHLLNGTRPHGGIGDDGHFLDL